jgi:hypothetical protein
MGYHFEVCMMDKQASEDNSIFEIYKDLDVVCPNEGCKFNCPVS